MRLLGGLLSPKSCGHKVWRQDPLLRPTDSKSVGSIVAKFVTLCNKAAAHVRPRRMPLHLDEAHIGPLQRNGKPPPEVGIIALTASGAPARCVRNAVRGICANLQRPPVLLNRSDNRIELRAVVSLDLARQWHRKIARVVHSHEDSDTGPSQPLVLVATACAVCAELAHFSSVVVCISDQPTHELPLILACTDRLAQMFLHAEDSLRDLVLPLVRGEFLYRPLRYH
jgi:hypothetical protein